MNRNFAVGAIVVAAVVVGLLALYASQAPPKPPTSSTKSVPASGTISFFGNNTIVFNPTSGGYKYTSFPYSNFTFNNFTFAYSGGSCQNASPGIPILPCGSTLYATFPASGRHSIPTEAPASSLHKQNGFQWTSTGISVVDGRMETVGLVLVTYDTGSRVVYVYAGVER